MLKNDYHGVSFREPMPREQRAKQFMPFAALKGYYTLVHDKETIPSERKELTEDAMRLLEMKLGQVKRGTLVKIVYYDKNAYQVQEGIVTEIDYVHQRLRVTKNYIALNDIWDISGEGIYEPDECY